jgi:ribose transport system substrate-binding protein
MKKTTTFRLHISVSAVAVLTSVLLLGAFSVRAEEPDRLRGIVEPVVAKTPFKIGVTLVHLNDDFWKGIAYGISDEAKRSNVTVSQVTIAGAYGNVSQQFAQLETLRSLGVDYAVLGAAAFKGYDPELKRLKEAGIGVIAAGIPVDSAQVDFGVTQDDTAIGTALADEVCRAKGSDKATVLTVPGPAGAEWARLRNSGFNAKAATCPGLSVVEGAVGGALGLERGLAVASDLLQKHSEAKYIYTPEISLGLGAAQAVRQTGSQAQIVSSSIVREAIPLLKSGKVLAAASEPAIVMGRLIVQYAIRKHEKLPMPGLQNAGSPYPSVLTPITIITSANADTYPYELYELPPKNWSLNAMQ